MTAPFKLKHLIPSEDSEAQCLIQWARVMRYEDRRLSDLLIMIPNGAYLGSDPKQRAITMARMKRTGFRPGVFDYLLAIPRVRGNRAVAGLWIELKRRHLGVVSEEQNTFRLDMEALGWATAICKGWEEAKAAITEYLG
jgi:hypothetical protein